MAVRVGTKVYSEYFGRGVVRDFTSDGFRVEFNGTVPNTEKEDWCKHILTSYDNQLRFYKNLKYYPDDWSGGTTPQHQLKTINTKIKIIKE